MIRHAWLQKHPTPSASDGEFHWHPADGDRELRAGIVERARGVEPPAVIWELAPGRVCWAQAFAATAPRDHRRYTGLVLTIVERAGTSPAELLGELALPSATPWTADARATSVEARDPFSPARLAALARTLISDDAEASEVLVSGLFDALPAAVATLEAIMPVDIHARVRRGVWRIGAEETSRAPDRVAMLAAKACVAPGLRPAQAWRLLCELAAATGLSVDDVVAELAMLDGADFALTLHDWGRGRLDRTAPSDALLTRFADALASRVLASLIADRDPGAVVAAARWHALMPADRRELLFATCARRCPSLRELAGGAYA